MTLSECIECLLGFSDREERYLFLRTCLRELPEEEIESFAEALKNRVTELILEDTERAIVLADCILVFPEVTGDEYHRALGLRMKGLAMVQGKGDFQGALPLYQEAVAIHQANSDRKGEALVYLNEIWALANLGRYEEAIKKGEWAKKIFEERNDRFSFAKVCNNLALVYYRLGQFRTSLGLLDHAIEIYREFGKDAESLLSAAENNRALNLLYVAHYQEAIQAGERAVEWGDNLGQPIAVARAKHNLGLILTLQGHFTRALTLFEEARLVHEKYHQPHEAALCQLSAMGCLYGLRRFSEIVQLDDEIRPVFNRLNMHHEEAQTILTRANALIETKKFEDAISGYRTAHKIYEREGNRALMGLCDLGRAKVYFHLNEFSKCIELGRKCAKEFLESGLLFYYGVAYLILAQAARSVGNLHESEGALDKIGEMFEENKWAELYYRYFEIRGDISRDQNRPDDALRYFEQAIDTVEQVRGNIMVEYRSKFIEDKQNVYEKIVDLCLECETPEKGFQFAERAKSRALVELLAYRPDLSIRARNPNDSALVEKIITLREQRETRLRHGINLVTSKGKEAQEQVLQLQQEVQAIEKKITALWHQLLIHNADYARDASLWEVRTESLPPLSFDSLLIEFFSINNQWVVFLVSSRGEKVSVRGLRLQITTREIENLLQRFQVNLGFIARSTLPHHENLIQNAQGILRQLYDGLFAPAAPYVVDVSNLIIVPHGPLHYLPFQALFDGEHYLVEKHQICNLPSASLLKDRPINTNEAAGTLVFGHSFRGRLTNAVEEARQVAQLWNVEAICEEEASPQMLLSLAENARLIHLACHGEFRSDNPLFSGLALEGGWLTTLDVFNLRLQASLVALSACETGGSVIGGGDELFGLMRAFLSAGASSLLLTRWSVSDQSTALLMEKFYEELKAGVSKAAALRSIQAQLLSSEEKNMRKFQHPYYWAPFYLVGQDGYL